MFSKLLTVVLVSALALKVNAHAVITPELGISGTPSRNDVQRPSNSAGCGTTNVESTIDKSTPVLANADGEFTVNVTNFNAGQDGSRKVSASLDETGVGKTFSKTLNITQNGDAAPTSVGSDQVVATLPPGTQCSGGADKNLCLVSFKTTAGFGNCVVVKQDSATNGSDNTTTVSSSGTNFTQATSASTTQEASSTASSEGAAPTDSDSPDCDHSNSDSTSGSTATPTPVPNSSEATVTQTVTNTVTVTSTATVSASALPTQQGGSTAEQTVAAAAAQPSSSIIQLTVGGTRSPRALRYAIGDYSYAGGLVRAYD